MIHCIDTPILSSCSNNLVLFAPMVYNHLAGNISTPQLRRPSDPTWSTRTQSTNLFTPSRSTLRTPSSGKKSNPRTTGFPRTRPSPYLIPEKTRITTSPGKTCPMLLLTPQDYKDSLAKEALERTGAGSTPSNTPGRARLPGRKPKMLLFPPSLGVGMPSTKLVLPPMQGTPRKVKIPHDPTRPTVQLLRVMYKCWDDDTEKESNWTVTNALLNGRNDERDRRGMWNTLGSAVYKVWPDLGGWIMRNQPSDNDILWIKSASIYSVHDKDYIYDPKLATKASSQDQVGFHMSASTYDAACHVLRGLAGRSRDLQCLLHSGINPFFVIYACADCQIPLPSNFNRQLLWKHLDGILRAKCWRGLRSTRADTQHHTNANANADFVPSKFHRMAEDPDDTLQSLLRLSYAESLFKPPRAPTADGPVHKLQITIEDYKWMAKAEAGTVWYQAGDLHDGDDIACFAVIDCLTRFLPSCRGGILEFSSDHIPLLWGIGGPPVGAWYVVQAVCKEYQVKLRAKWAELSGPGPSSRIDPTEGITVPPRDRDVVDVVLDELDRILLERKAAHDCMVAHLSQTSHDLN